MTVKRPLVVDSLIVVALLAVHLLLVREFGDKATGWLPNWAAAVVGVVGISTLLVRRRWTRTVFLVVLVASLTLVLGGYPSGGAGLGLQVALYTVAVNSSLVSTVVAAALTLVAAVTSYVSNADFHPVVAVLDVVLLGGSIGLGMVTRRSRQRSAQLREVVSQLEQAREQLKEEAALLERTRIARELHDIVTHSLGVIAVQAGVARAMPDDQQQAREALQVIEATSKDALSEMRHLLGALRVPEALDAELRPQPTLGQLEDLFQTMRDVGLSLTVQTEGEPYPLTAGRELTVYRIIQEALTNVLKHAAHAEVQVRLRYLDDHMSVEVLNDHVLPHADGHGHGLVGMRERAVVCGGTLDAGPLPGGRFRMVATLPRELAA
ncbi:sensor histidine kinase [Lentzea sp. NPDC051213]|uniref:sensor histidine kinase n=1 Tax=Lentzea sp. NPDC051213 TaxID=3364126 RepID=UPI0037A264AE